MNKVYIKSGSSFEADGNDSIVRAALRNGVGFPYECSSGSCGTCKFTLIDGQVEDLYPGSSGLSERDRRKGRKLACQCRPLTNITIKALESEDYVPLYKPQRNKAKIVSVKNITHNIVSLTFDIGAPAKFLPGQYALIEAVQLGERAYSMSNLENEDKLLEFFIKKVPGGKISELFFDPVKLESTEFVVDGPYGVAYIRENDRSRICLAGGSGLAPMISIARHHIAENSNAKLTFIFGGQKNKDTLSQEEFRSMVGDEDGVIDYISVVSDEMPSGNNRKGYLHEVLIDEFGNDLKGFDIYCAGPPAMINALESVLYSISFPTNQLYFDRFF